MIPFIEKTIRKELGGKYDFRDTKLCFLKFSTPSSGAGLNDKVLFFVFKDDEEEPFLVIKTVRNYEAKFVIEQGFSRLKQLNDLIQNIPYGKMFPHAVYLYDDGKEFIFSVETTCHGKRVGRSEGDLRKILEKYNDWQKDTFSGGKNFTYDINNYYLDVIKTLDLKEKDHKEITDYFLKLISGKEIKVSRIPQHGDLTTDNILIGRDGLSIVDCERFGLVTLPGFDIFYILSRFYGRKIDSRYSQALDKYFQMLGIGLKPEPYLYFIYYLYDLSFKKEYALKNKKAKDIISDFETSLN